MQFAAQPFAQEAIRLRRYDDHAKVPGLVTRSLKHYMALLERQQVRGHAPAMAC